MSVIYATVSALIVLGVLIIIHELGHFLLAKMSGVGVLTFSVGFGPKLWIRKSGETEYALSAFPLGGYVKMVGEDPTEEVKEVDVQRSFSHQGLAKRAAIVAAGPLFNLLLAAAILAGLSMFIGVAVLTTRIDRVEHDSPAAKVGIQKGDRVIKVDGRPVKKWEELSVWIKESQGKPLTIRLLRDNREIEVAVQPTKREARNIYGQEIEIWIIGISGEHFFEKSPPWVAVGQGLYRTGEYSVITLVGLFKMIKGEISPKNLGGPILIAQKAGEQVQEGLVSFLVFVALISINLGILNFLPIPVLDGGHLLFFLMEWILGRPVELKHRERAQQVGIFILILIMMYAFYNDIARFFEG
jgi:regulator of sigma E protease